MTHLSPSFWVHTTSKCSDKSSCSQTKAPCEKLCFCFEIKILPFSGILSEVRSIVEITKGVQSKILDHKFLKLWTYQPPSPLLSLSLSLHAGADTQALFTQCLPVECIVFSFFIRPFEKRTYYAMAMSVRLSVRPSVRPSFPDFFSTCFEISIWNLVYAFSRWHDMSSLSFITIGTLWPSLQPKVGQTQFLQSWPYKSR